MYGTEPVYGPHPNFLKAESYKSPANLIDKKADIIYMQDDISVKNLYLHFSHEQIVSAYKKRKYYKPKKDSSVLKKELSRGC